MSADAQVFEQQQQVLPAEPQAQDLPPLPEGPFPVPPPPPENQHYAQGFPQHQAQGFPQHQAQGFPQHQAQGFPPIGQPGLPGMNNALLNANFAIHRAMLAEQQSRIASQNCDALAKAQTKVE